MLFSIFGEFWLFWITGTSFGIMSFIGILVLMGVVVNNGIVMIEHINNLRRRGMARTEALVDGSRERLRPIMMTMGTAILAMVPISLTNTQMFGNGPEYAPMARAIAGGLAGLYYGYDRIPADWLEAIKKREWIEELCDMA